MMIQRRIERIVTPPPAGPGFIGRGHTAVEVLTPQQGYRASDPFILLMDDRLDTDGMRVGDAHPHAGIETVTLVVDGSIHDRDEGVLAANCTLDEGVLAANCTCVREGTQRHTTSCFMPYAAGLAPRSRAVGHRYWPVGPGS